MENQFNPEDKITVDIPLFIRLLEFAREDAKTDLDLHVVTENAIALSKDGHILTMDNYNDIVKNNSKEDNIQEAKRFQKLAGILTEMKVNNPNKFSDNFVKQLLSNNGIDEDYLEDMGGIESGSEEWMDVLSELTGKNAYGTDFDKDDNEKIKKLVIVLNKMGIDLV